MPQYIKKTSTLKARAATHTKVVSGDITLEEGWEQIKGMCPLFTDQPYSEAHDNFTDSFLTVMGQAPAFKNKQADKDVLKQVNEDYVAYRYIQNTSYDEDKKIYTCDIVEYFKDQASVDLANDALNATETYGKELPEGYEEPTYKTVDFHRPYPS